MSLEPNQYAQLGQQLRAASKWSNLVKGATSTFEGVGILVRSPSLLGLALFYAFVALAILALLLVGTGFLAVWVSAQLVDTVLGWTGEPSASVHEVLSWLAIVTVFLILLFPTLVLWKVVRGVFTSRIRERLSQKTQKLLRPDLKLEFPIETPFVQELLSAPKTIVFGLTTALFMSFALLLLNLIPVLGQVLSIGVSVFLSAREMGEDLLNTTIAGKGLDASKLKAFKARTPGLWLGVGAGATLMSLIPVLNVLTIPGSVIGAAHLYLAVDSASPGSTS
ncbi:MAG: hypothetical protein AUK47_12520 [Deltaproteobacteria bacterium CG2_30_63_29]|nr:MAG: hypothetical protein AUK47_12520 [Deltaproteobacteria bacterium CG2_30_63_29]